MTAVLITVVNTNSSTLPPTFGFHPITENELSEYANEFEASPRKTLYGTFPAKFLPDAFPPSLAVQRYSGVNFKISILLPYHYVTAVRKFATVEYCCTAEDGGQKSGRSSAKKAPYSVIRGEASINKRCK
jgi:hypothetical protein